MVTTPHPAPGLPLHVADLLRLVTRDPGRPRLTWYGDDGERIELSGAVLENWINKTTNLLIEEYDAEPGVMIAIDLPAHWRTAVWSLAAWRTGATVVLPSAEPAEPGGPRGAGRPEIEVVVTHRPEAWAHGDAAVVAVALPALARRFDGDLPPGAVDAAAAVMTYGDQLGWVPDVDLEHPALLAGEDVVRHRDLVDPSDAPAPDDAPGRPARVLVPTAGLGTGDLVRRAVAAWARDGSVVLVATSDDATDDATDHTRVTRLARIAADEQVTHRP